jgi:APA family basic amino acid/polyamine antiporter
MLFLGVWVIGGVISLFGCVAFAELGSMFPESGGQYVYLREAYGDLVAFLYGWMLFAVANGGSIAALSVAAAAYTGQVFPAVSQDHITLSLGGISITRAHLLGLLLIAILTWINVVGLRWGALLQNLSTWTKFAAMGAFVILGLAIGKGDWSHFRSHGAGLTIGLHPTELISAMGIALIAVFWAYDGWVYITWVAGEVKEPRRNVPLAMVLGVIVVGVIYMAMNVTYLYALPLGEIAQHETIAHAAAAAMFANDRHLLLQRRRDMYFIWCTRLPSHGARWSLLQAHGGNPSQVAHARLQSDRARSLGRASHSQRALRPALHLRDLRHGPFIHADRHRNVSAALEAP